MAQTTVTRYCSSVCNRRDYKQKLRNASISKAEESVKKTDSLIPLNIEQLKAKEFLTVKEAAFLLGTTRRTLYRMISARSVNAVNLAERKTIIRRSDIEILFNKNSSGTAEAANEVIKESRPINLEEWVKNGGESINECYTINEVIEKYSISESAVLNLIKRNEIPRLKAGWHHYVSKKVIDSLFGNIVKP